MTSATLTPELAKSIDESELFMGDDELKIYKTKKINDEFAELFSGIIEDDGLDEILKEI